MNAALLIDFGSTYTKLRAVDLDAGRLLATAQGPSTVATDITTGLHAALAALERRMGALPRFRYRLACSSAAGGLRMVTIGLVRELTAEAARRAALGAGARLVGAYAYTLTRRDIEDILALAPDIVLLAGGTDGGNGAVATANAAALARSALACPIVYAGNRDVAEQVQSLLAGKRVIVTDNVMPEFNELDIEPARAALRRVFIDHIVHAKGMDRARADCDGVLMPTPVAVMEGARLVARGSARHPGLGETLVVDPGGATTDVHSIAAGAPAEGVVRIGLPEPEAMRTVEGDLGMRHNAAAVADAAGLEALAADAGLATQDARSLLASLQADVERLPATASERALDRALARAAVRIAVTRHCGTVETVYAPTGPVTVQHGKDLSRVAVVIGTGGAIVAAPDPRAILDVALGSDAEPLSLRPRSPRVLLDRDYLLYACGLLAAVEPDAALAVALAHLEPLPERLPNERQHA